MDDQTARMVAAQLRQPHGDFALEVGERMNEGNLFMNLSTIETLRIAPHDYLLEVGMGNGFFVKDILEKERHVKYAGCDFSAEMVEEAKKRNAAFIEAGRAEFHFTVADKLPFADGTFDKLFTVNTIYFWDNPVAVLNEFYRVLKPEGRLFIALRPKATMIKYPFTQYNFNMFTREELVALLRENRFRTYNAVEIQEPPTAAITGEEMVLETLIVCAEK